MHSTFSLLPDGSPRRSRCRRMLRETSLARSTSTCRCRGTEWQKRQQSMLRLSQLARSCVATNRFGTGWGAVAAMRAAGALGQARCAIYFWCGISVACVSTHSPLQCYDRERRPGNPPSGQRAAWHQVKQGRLPARDGTHFRRLANNCRPSPLPSYPFPHNHDPKLPRKGHQLSLESVASPGLQRSFFWKRMWICSATR